MPESWLDITLRIRCTRYACLSSGFGFILEAYKCGSLTIYDPSYKPVVSYLTALSRILRWISFSPLSRRAVCDAGKCSCLSRKGTCLSALPMTTNIKTRQSCNCMHRPNPQATRASEWNYALEQLHISPRNCCGWIRLTEAFLETLFTPKWRMEGSPMKTLWLVNTVSVNHSAEYVDHDLVHGLHCVCQPREDQRCAP